MILVACRRELLRGRVVIGGNYIGMYFLYRLLTVNFEKFIKGIGFEIFNSRPSIRLEPVQTFINLRKRPVILSASTKQAIFSPLATHLEINNYRCLSFVKLQGSREHNR